jgi:hypothetical protein
VSLILVSENKNTNFSFPELTEDLKKKLKWASCQKSARLQMMKVLFEKLENAKLLQDKIQEVKAKSDFRTEEEMREEEAATKERIQEPLKLNAKITELRNSDDFLDSAQIRELKLRTDYLKSTLKRDDDDSEDDVRHSDLECVVCKSLPNYVDDPVDETAKRFKNSSKMLKGKKLEQMHMLCEGYVFKFALSLVRRGEVKGV